MACWWWLTVLSVVQGVEVVERVGRRRRLRRRATHRSRGRGDTMRRWDVPPDG